VRCPGLFHGVAFDIGVGDERFHAERAELLSLLRRDGILRASEAQPVVSYSGTPARWMLDSLRVSLTPRGAALAGRCLLRLCERFDGRQIATYGVTGIPLLQAVVLSSGGRHSGLIVRHARKTHGSMKLIEGPLDPDEPVILLDDSVVSGVSMSEGIDALEDAGLRVEGGVCLVRFGWSGGFAKLQERGYHMEALYDIWEDFMYHMPDEDPPVRNPTKIFPEIAFARSRAAAGIHPAVYARQAMQHWLRTGTLVRPPVRFDRRYDSRGGAWVSLRRRDDVYDRPAREGFWHLPGEAYTSVGHDIALAALCTAAALPSGKRGSAELAACSVAVTLFTALEECAVAGLDNDRYGILVRSRERGETMGGALPRMPGIGGEWAQLEHARRNNAELASFEPFVVYRHDVTKAVEPGAIWQPTGVPADRAPVWHDPAVCGRVAARALDVARSLRGGVTTTAALPDDALPASADSIYVTVYARGRIRGCVGGPIERLDDDVRHLVERALDDQRFADVRAELDDLAVSVSILHGALELGAFSPEELMRRVRPGEQAVLVWQGDRLGLLLPFVAARNSLGSTELALEVIDKAGITRPPYHWCRFECVTWLAAAGLSEPRRLCGALVPGEPPGALDDAVARFTPLFAGYLLRHQREDGTFRGSYAPFSHTFGDELSISRLAHAGWTLARGGRILGDARLARAADRTLAHVLELVELDDAGRPWISDGEEPPAIAALAFVLLAIAELPARRRRAAVRRSRGAVPRRAARRSDRSQGPAQLPAHAPVHAQADALASTLWSCIDPHGRFRTHRDPDDDDDAAQDYFPGQALLALARAAETAIHPADDARLHRAFRYYRHRFRYHRSWGQVSWLMQAFAAWHRVTQDPAHAALVFEIGEVAMASQLDKTGGFVNELLPDGPGFTTAVFLEGIAAAVGVAQRVRDAARLAAFQSSLTRGLRFLDRLIYQPRDALVLPEPSWALGGVRLHERASEVRVDFVQHALSTMLEIKSHEGGRA
jgi:AMMECR1 domain-containing protein/orotate phosphoribosyltransferase